MAPKSSFAPTWVVPKAVSYTHLEADYMFTYYSGAKARGGDFAALPERIDLSSQDLKEEYAKVSFAVDDENTVYGAPIVHALTIPETAKFKEMCIRDRGHTGHNYFLYEENGVLSILPWDYNLAFGTYASVSYTHLPRVYYGLERRD